MKYSILLVLLLIVSLNASAQMFSGRCLLYTSMPTLGNEVSLVTSNTDWVVCFFSVI